MTGEGIERTSTHRWEHAVVVAFAAVLAVSLWRHEMWRDELQAWTLTHTSTGLRDLLHNLRYEGHPTLWYLLLFPITRLTDTPEAMQVLQLAVSVGTAALVMRYAPCSLGQRAALLFGYFWVFEYGTLSRSYSLGVLLTVGVCVIASRAERRWWLVGVLLALLALTSAFGAMVAVAIGAGLVLDEVLRRRAADPRSASLQSLAIGATIAIGGVIVAYAQSIPPSDAGEYRGWRTTFDAGEIGSTLAAVWRAFVPVPQLQREFWNTNVADGRVTIAAVLSVLIVLGITWVFRSKPAAVLTWLLGVTTILVFLYAKIAYASSARHLGHLFLVFVAISWLAPSYATAGPGRDRSDTMVEVRAAILTVVLGLHALAGAFALVVDWTTPFSDGRAVADHLTATGRADDVIVGFPDTAASTVAAYLGRDVFFPQGGRFGSYIIWDRRRSEPSRTLDELAADFAEAGRITILVLRTEPLPVVPPNMTLLRTFDAGVVIDEHYWLYELTLGPGRPD